MFKKGSWYRSSIYTGNFGEPRKCTQVREDGDGYFPETFTHDKWWRDDGSFTKVLFAQLKKLLKKGGIEWE